MGDGENKALRDFLRGQGISDAAIEELFKGNAIQVIFEDYPTPWPATAKREIVYKDGRSVGIDPKRKPD